MNHIKKTGIGGFASGFSEGAEGLDTDKSIEQMCKHLPSDCRFRTRSGHCFRGTDSSGSATYVHAYCNRLTCRTCARRICQALLRSISAAVSTSGLRHHLVLTLPSAVRHHEAEPLVKSAFRKLILAAKRAFGNLSFVWTLGVTGRGRLHLHALVSADLSKAVVYGRETRWLRNKWHALTGGHQVSSTEFPESDAWNLAHYLVVNMISTVAAGLPLRRRYGCSRGIALRPRAPRLDGVTWERLDRPSAAFAVEHGIDPRPVLNPTFKVPAPSDAMASPSPSLGEPPLERRAAGPTVPAGGRAGLGTLLHADSERSEHEQ